MQIFLAWRRANETLIPQEPVTVETRLQKVFTKIFATPPASRILQNAAGALVWLEIPIQGWLPQHFESDGGAWALAPEYPSTARVALVRRGIAAPEGRVLLTLASQLDRNPEPLLRDMAPMYSLLWNHGDDEIVFQNDGLGQAQVFEYDDGNVWAISNKIAAFRALGLTLDPVAAEWAVRMTLDWFPGQMTGYRNIRFLAPATRLRVTRGGVKRTQYDVLRHWLQRDPSLTPQDCLELAYEGFHEHIRGVAPLWSEARCGLTGGLDSRAVASGLLKEGIDNVTFAVRGRKESADVEIALQCAEIAQIPLHVRKRAMRPPNNLKSLRRGIMRALLWQAGYIDIRQHASFMRGSDDLGGGDVNIMGQHGEIGRGYFASRLQADRLRPDQFEAALLRFAMFENTPGHHLIRRNHLPFIQETITAAFREAGRYGLDGLDRLDFFYLFERTRRWASAGNHIQPGHIVTPFLIPEYIHAVYNYPASTRPNEPFHEFIVQRNLPGWAGIIYEKELVRQRQAKADRAARRHGRLKWYRQRFLEWLEELKLRHYPSLLRPGETGYWKQVGQPLIEDILQADGPWTEVFDPDRARKMWFLASEQLVITALLPEAFPELPCLGECEFSMPGR